MYTTIAVLLLLKRANTENGQHKNGHDSSSGHPWKREHTHTQIYKILYLYGWTIKVCGREGRGKGGLLKKQIWNSGKGVHHTVIKYVFGQCPAARGQEILFSKNRMFWAKNHHFSKIKFFRLKIFCLKMVHKRFLIVIFKIFTKFPKFWAPYCHILEQF